MIGKILGAVAGQRVAQNVSGVNGPAGALLGAGAVSVARRLGPIGLVVAGLGGYAFKRYRDKAKRQHAQQPHSGRRAA